jgi:hypothetical protein
MIALDRLQQIIPSEWAVANKALSVSLEQVTGIMNMTLPEFATAVSAIGSNAELPLVNSLTQPVPSSVANFYANQFGIQGTGVNGTIVISDSLGTAAGYNYTSQFVDTVSQMSNIGLGELTTIYVTMLNVVDGVFGTGPVVIPPGNPAAGTYATRDSAVATGLIPSAQTEIANVATLYPGPVSLLNQYWTEMGNQLLRERSLQAASSLNWSTLDSNAATVMLSWISNLPSRGLDVEPGGSNDFIRSIADMTSFTGQCVVGCLQQGQNQTAFDQAGISTGLDIPVK